MKAKLISLMIGSLFISGLAFADHHHDREFSISFNSPQPPPQPTYVVERTETVVVPGYGHHHNRGPEWVDMYEGAPVPSNAVIGGSQYNPTFTLYVCRASYNGGVHPGKLIGGKCNIGWGGNEISLSRYQVLVSRAPLRWLATSYGNIPGNAVSGGYQSDQQLYICQADYNGGTHPGKVVGNMCNIGWGGQEISTPYYNVLVG